LFVPSIIIVNKDFHYDRVRTGVHWWQPVVRSKKSSSSRHGI